MITKAKEILAAAKDKMSHAVSHLDEELKTYRAGKADPRVFNNVIPVLRYRSLRSKHPWQ